jgi:hypothetical protein
MDHDSGELRDLLRQQAIGEIGTAPPSTGGIRPVSPVQRSSSSTTIACPTTVRTSGLARMTAS